MAFAHRRARDASNTENAQNYPMYPKKEKSWIHQIFRTNRSFPSQISVLLLTSLIGACVSYFFIMGYTNTQRTLTEPFYDKTMLVFNTKHGNFTIELYPESAPLTVETFMKLIDSGFYTSESGFYRNEPNFVLQGGGFLAGKKPNLDSIPVEYRLPSIERTVVMTHQHDADSEGSDFAIMLHDNSESNMPTPSSSGYTTFGRVVRGWHTIERISKIMPVGYLSRSERHKQVSFTNVEYQKCMTNDDPEAKARLEELNYVIETPYTAVIFAKPGCTEAAQIATLLHEIHASHRLEDVGDSNAHVFERDALAAISGHTSLPLIHVDQHWIAGMQQFEQEMKSSLRKILQLSGTLAQPFAWSVIQENPLVVFSKSYCPYCKKAKTLLASLDAKPFVVELDLRSDGAAIQEFLFQITDQLTVPNIFIQRDSIGGSDKAQELFDSGELKDRLQRARAIP